MSQYFGSGYGSSLPDGSFGDGKASIPRGRNWERQTAQLRDEAERQRRKVMDTPRVGGGYRVVGSPSSSPKIVPPRRNPSPSNSNYPRIGGGYGGVTPRPYGGTPPLPSRSRRSRPSSRNWSDYSRYGDLSGRTTMF